MRAAKLLGIAFVTWVACVAYTFNYDPGIVFWKQAVRIKQAWAQKMTREHGAKILVYGGSSCSFSIDGESLLEKHGLPVVNMGLEAGDGAKMLTQWALSETRPGDTLIVALEPGLLTRASEESSSAVQLSYAMGKPDWIKNIDGSPYPGLVSSLLMLRPGALTLCIHVGKILRGDPGYRYKIKNVHPSGWIQTDVRDARPDQISTPQEISPAMQHYLQALSDWCKIRHVRLAYSLPWLYVTPAHLSDFQKDNLSFLIRVSNYMPVLKDPVLGACSTPEYFADTAWHLTGQGAQVRNEAFARQIQTWDVWSKSELEKMLADRSAPPK
jgi:hypothetical protein